MKKDLRLRSDGADRGDCGRGTGAPFSCARVAAPRCHGGWHELGLSHWERGRLARLGRPAHDGYLRDGGGAAGAMEDCGRSVADLINSCSNGRTAADLIHGCSNGRRTAYGATAVTEVAQRPGTSGMKIEEAHGMSRERAAGDE
jgi:hypothetical protein